MGSMLLSVCAVLLALEAVGFAGAHDLATEPPPSGICGLEGFHLNKLELSDSWHLTLTDKTHCIIPYGANESDVASCTITFSVCKPLSSCNRLTTSSTCEEVTLTNGTKVEYDIGAYRGNDEFEALGGTTVGFTAARQGSQPVDSRLCNSTYEIFLVWQCDEHKQWDPSTKNANPYFISSARVGVTPCLLEINLGFDGACYTAPTLAPDTCQLEPYNFVGLSSQDYWTASVSSDMCYQANNEACRIFVSFCGALPLLSTGSGCYGAAVCQYGTKLDGKEYSQSMGLFKTAKYAANNGEVGGGFHLDVENGSTPNNDRCSFRGGIRTRVVLSCDPSAKWTNQDLANNFHIVYDKALDPCVYNIELQYDGACEPVGPIEPGPGRTPQSFVGWILIGIFCFAVMVYLFVGAGFEYFVKGARGVEVIPNYAFWTLFFSLVLGGCKYSFNAITCFKFEDKIKLGGPGKSGIDYDKI